MSLARLIYYSAIVSGWAAFFGWLAAEILFINRTGGRLEVILAAGMVGGAIGAGVSLVAGLANNQWVPLLIRAVVGFVGGWIGGAIGGMVGDLLFAAGLPRAFGWMVMGIGIGVVDGLYERSRSNVRNGLIGGALGGFLGGVLFNALDQWLTSGSGMSSRATGFVVLGVSIGALIGLAQVVLKDAWLTVLDGYRSGRQLILSQPVVVLGRGEHLPLPFLGAANQELEKEHVRITRLANGTYQVEDLQTKVGSRLNKQPLHAPTRLQNDDVIKLGGNFVRFNERQRHRGEKDDVASAPVATKPVTVRPAPPPPPAGKRPAAETKAPIGTVPSAPAAPTARIPTAPPAAGNRSGPLRPPPPPPRPKRQG